MSNRQVQLPKFIAKDVKFWFIQVEALFRTANITTDQTKYDFVIAALDITAAADVRDILENPAAENQYENIKKALVERLAVSEAARIKQILSNERMGDRTPGQHYRYLKSVAGDNFSDAVLSSIWMDSLPQDVKTVIAGNYGLTIDRSWLTWLDRIFDVAGSSRNIAHNRENTGILFYFCSDSGLDQTD